ncbi:HPr(Ser) kinase/phosphatase [Tissierella sp. Yu-01]|uniref:HPr(Ser) kinase/phosphatase n=1 Tax=Tissierella sp. Yu-01 TaxID=3035694 RepID=UPI00240E2F09|nr:HPr(Ser) kinase/phosphatase [Tissierella sp. Yu-01]WFA09161.1 HPr(Ser) kinase/phosphatase [Tissierella sp. Yu-01]
MQYITLDQLINELDLEVIYKATDAVNVKIYSAEINRPGLPIVGYFEKFAPERLQIIGSSEWHYYNDLPDTLRYDSLDKFLTYPIPALIFSRNLEIFPEVIELAEKHNRTILRVDIPTSKLINELINHINFSIAPSTTVHGVLLEVYGIGVLITGKSGVGKSETALELLIRGHRLVSDDTVEIKKVEDRLRGESPALTRHFMEIRGIGILDIERLYGVGAVKQYEFIDLIVELELWDENKFYDRIGLDEETVEILDVKVPRVTIPLRPGRNTAMIVEVAARNNRQKKLGYNAAHVLNDRIMKEIEKRKNIIKK